MHRKQEFGDIDVSVEAVKQEFGDIDVSVEAVDITGAIDITGVITGVTARPEQPRKPVLMVADGTSIRVHPTLFDGQLALWRSTAFLASVPRVPVGSLPVPKLRT